jgi:transposase
MRCQGRTLQSVTVAVAGPQHLRERSFNKLKQWSGIAMRSDKLARNYHAGLCLAATLRWLTSSFSKTS